MPNLFDSVKQGDIILDINDERFEVLQKTESELFVRDLQDEDTFWIEKDLAEIFAKRILN